QNLKPSNFIHHDRNAYLYWYIGSVSRRNKIRHVMQIGNGKILNSLSLELKAFHFALNSENLKITTSQKFYYTYIKLTRQKREVSSPSCYEHRQSFIVDSNLVLLVELKPHFVVYIEFCLEIDFS